MPHFSLSILIRVATSAPGAVSAAAADSAAQAQPAPAPDSWSPRRRRAIAARARRISRLAFHRPRRDRQAATRSSTPTSRGSTPDRTGPSPPATSSSRRATIGSRPSAPSSTPRRVSARSTTRGASPRCKPPPQPARPAAIAPPPMAGQENDRLLFRRDGREDRPEEIQDHQRRLLDLRAADAALGSARRHGHPERRSLHPADQRGAERQGRADVLSAGPVLPDQARGSRDRLSDSDLRQLDAARPVDSQRVLLGDRSQPGRDDSARLVFEDRPGRRRRVPLQLRRAASTATCARTCSTSTPPPTCSPTAATAATPARELRHPRQRQPAAARHTCARACNVNYFSSIVASQTFNTNIYDASRNQRIVRRQRRRRVEQLHAERDVRSRSEYFNSDDDFVVVRQLAADHVLAQRAADSTGSPAYFSISDRAARSFANPADVDRSDTSEARSSPTDCGLSRFDIAPQIRYPFKKWQWFTVNSTVSWHETYYTRSLALDANGRCPTNVVDRPGAEPPRVHVPGADRGAGVQPRVGHAGQRLRREVQAHHRAGADRPRRRRTIDNFDRDRADRRHRQLRRRHDKYNYGLNNRFYAKRRSCPDSRQQAREIVDVELSRRYYTRRTAVARTTRSYQTSCSTRRRTVDNFSPIALNIRAMPTTDAERDGARRVRQPDIIELRTISAQAAYKWTPTGPGTLGWSKRAFIAGAARSSTIRAILDHTINVTTNLHTTRQPVRAELLVQLRRAARAHAAAADHRRSTTRSAAGSRSSTRRSTTVRIVAGADPGRPPLLPVVHAGRPRQLLAVQRRARAASRADATHIAMPSDDPRHRRRRIRRQSSARSARAGDRDDRRVASARRTPPRAVPRRDGRRSISLDRAAVARAIDAAARRRSSITAPAPRTSAARGTHRADLRGQRPRHAPSARRAASAHGVDARVLDPELGAGLCAVRPSRSTKTHPLVPVEPVRLEQAGAGNARRADERPTCPWRSRGRSIISARGRIRISRRRASRGGSPTSSAAGGRRRSRSATSTRAAT